MRLFAEWRFLTTTLSEQISNGMYSSSWEYKKNICQNDVWSIPIGMLIFCFTFTFPMLRYKFSIK